MGRKRHKSKDISLKDFSPKQAALRLINGQNGGMMNITINIPILYEDQIQKLKAKGIVASRSDAVRTAIRDFLLRELKFIEELEK